MNRKIINISPSDGWQAVFAEHGKPQAYPLTQWALVEDVRGDRRITGVIKTGRGETDVEERKDFLGYLAPGYEAESVFGQKARKFASKGKPKRQTELEAV